jgi:WD40 repeat protein
VTIDPFVFISYSRKDSEYVEGLVTYLAEHGISAWIDRERITNGDRWTAVIERQVEACTAMVVVMSPAAKDSNWVEREVTLAEERQKPILPLLLGGEPLFYIRNVHYDDVLDGRIPPPGFVQRLRTVTGALTPAVTPEPAPAAAPVQPRKLSGPRRGVDPLPIEIVPRAQITGDYDVVAIAPDASWFATGGTDQHVRLWDAQTGELLLTQPRHPEPIRQIFIGPEGDFLITTTDKALRWWDSSTALADPLRVWLRPEPPPPTPAAPTTRQPSRVGGPDRRQWGPPPRLGRTMGPPGSGPDDYDDYDDYDDRVDARGPRRGLTPEPNLAAPTAAISLNGTWLAVVQNQAVLRFDTAPGGGGGEAVIDLSPQHGTPSALGAIAISPDGRRLAIADTSGSMYIRYIPDGQPVQPPHVTGTLKPGRTTAIAWAPDGTWLLTATAVTTAPSGLDTGPVTVFGTANGNVLGHVGAASTNVHSIAISPRGDWFATSDGTAVTIWRVATREPVARLAVAGTGRLGLSPDATWLLVGTNAGVAIYDLRYGIPGQKPPPPRRRSSRDE